MALPTAANRPEAFGEQFAEIRKLSTLLEASQALAAALDLKVGLEGVLAILSRHHGAARSTVVMRNTQTGEMEVEASVPSIGSERPIRHGVGEEIAGKVIQTGKPVVVPRVSEEPTFMNRAGGRPDVLDQELSYISVPIDLDSQTIGALGIDLWFKLDRDYERTVKFLSVVGSMIAQAVKVHGVLQSERQRLLDENTQLRNELSDRYHFSNLIGTSAPMRDVYQQIAQMAQTSATVLLRGESGTGKELIAHAIHYNSHRADKPFIRVSCGALPHDLIESELFGCQRGAFTGAGRSKKGRFDLADGGTLFLDEIGELGLATQVKLLRVLQEREFERLGGTATIRTNVRLIAATSKHLERAIASGEFREDLYDRLNVFAIFVPPLRDRKADVLLLADHFLLKYSAEHGRSVRRISTPVIDMLTSYHWPGNVCELANVMERAVIACEGRVLHAQHLPPTLQTAEASGTGSTQSLRETVDAVERGALEDALKSTRGNRAKAARLLRTTERVFNYKVRKHGINWRRFRLGTGSSDSRRRV